MCMTNLSNKDKNKSNTHRNKEIFMNLLCKKKKTNNTSIPTTTNPKKQIPTN